MYVKLLPQEQVYLCPEAKALLILVENTVPFYLHNTKESDLHEIVFNIIGKELLQNGLTLHQHTEQK